MTAFVDQLLQHIRIADLLDIAIVAVLMYVLLLWLRDRASRSLRIVAVALGAIFLLARWLDLYLTTMVFHYGLVGILLSLVVVFQNDLRYGFERLTASRWFHRPTQTSPTQHAVETITESVAQMANQRIGALIIVAGRESLDRHLRGGVTVDAVLSQQLLLSIFHPDSPGHDGAVLIDGNRIAQLGLHLPLTTQISKIRGSGTRHAAALGLAERSDALTIAVSEERGSITVAHDGDLQVTEPADISDQLFRYLDNQHNRRQQAQNPRWTDWLTMLAAAFAAATLWFLFAFHTDTIQRTFVVPIEYRNLPKGFEISSPQPSYVELTLSGPETAFALLEPTQLAVSLDIGEVGDRRILDWKTQPNLVNVPQELTIQNIAPQIVDVTIHPKSQP